MEEKDKQLLITDLCARLPYGVWVECCGVSGKLDNIWLTHFYNGGNTVIDVNGNTDFFHDSDYFDITKIKPYLRPMSSITEEEIKELDDIEPSAIAYGFSSEIIRIVDDTNGLGIKLAQTVRVIDWLNAHHFDYRGMIEKGLVLEAIEWMYK